MIRHEQPLVVGRAGINLPKFSLDPRFVAHDMFVAEKFDEWLDNLMQVNRHIVAVPRDHNNSDRQLILPPTEDSPLLAVRITRRTSNYSTPTGDIFDDCDPGYSTPKTTSELVSEHTVSVPPEAAASAMTYLYDSQRRLVNGTLQYYRAESGDVVVAKQEYGRGRQQDARQLLPGIETVLNSLGYGNPQDFDSTELTVGSYLDGLREYEHPLRSELTY